MGGGGSLNHCADSSSSGHEVRDCQKVLSRRKVQVTAWKGLRTSARGARVQARPFRQGL